MASENVDFASYKSAEESLGFHCPQDGFMDRVECGLPRTTGRGYTDSGWPPVNVY